MRIAPVHARGATVHARISVPVNGCARARIGVTCSRTGGLVVHVREWISSKYADDRALTVHEWGLDAS